MLIASKDSLIFIDPKKDQFLVSNPHQPQFLALEVEFELSNDHLLPLIPEALAKMLGLEEVELRTMAIHGKKEKMPFVGPVRFDFMGRTHFSGGLIYGNHLVIGDRVLQGMGLSILKDSTS